MVGVEVPRQSTMKQVETFAQKSIFKELTLTYRFEALSSTG